MIDRVELSELLKQLESEIANDYLFREWSWEDAFYASIHGTFGRYELTSDVTNVGTPPSGEIGYRGSGLALFLEFLPMGKSDKREFLGIFQSEDEALAKVQSHYWQFLSALKQKLSHRRPS